jgi:recombinational DNA repair protein (RecF pathway)
MKDNKEVLIPIWVLKFKVEADFQEYMFFNESVEGLQKEEYPKFPEYDSTITMLEALKKEGIEFDISTGVWKE